jgi:hypothetical protein
MNRRHAVAILGVFATALALFLSSRTEPKYGGKRLSAWITQLDDADPARRHKAQTAINLLGAKGRSWMIGQLNRPQPRIEKVLGGDRSDGLLTDYDVRRGKIATALALAGPAAAAAVPALELAATDREWVVADRAKAALMQIRGDSSGALSQSLTNFTEIAPWLRCACTLRALGTNVDGNIAAFLTTLQSDLSRAMDTVELLCTHHIDPAVSAPILVGCLRHPEAGVRGNCLNAVIANRSWGAAQRDAIVQCLSDPNPSVRANAMFALTLFPTAVLAAAPPSLVQALNQAANSSDPNQRGFAGGLLRKLPPGARR